jgi:hypothetical protein
VLRVHLQRVAGREAVGEDGGEDDDRQDRAAGQRELVAGQPRSSADKAAFGPMT